ncbi:MAG TPA: autotransporter [Solirubrobacteraceae bacterium]|nr:autotransporter [Solirubrobacteraceae bacterium]
MTRRIVNSSLAVAGMLGASACALAIGAGGASASGASAVAARTISLNESGRLHLTSHHGFHLNEQGSASGTIRGTIYIHLDVTSTNRVTAEVNIYPANGSLTGYGTAAYRSNGGTATFSGTMSISRGTGSYSHAHASGLSFSGAIQRSNDATTVRVSGPLSE